MKFSHLARHALARSAAPRSTVTQPTFEPPPLSAERQQQQRAQEQQEQQQQKRRHRRRASRMSASQESASSPATRPAEKPSTAPHVPSKLSNSFTPTSAESDTNGKMTGQQPAAAAAATPKDAGAKTDKPEEPAKLSNAELKKKAKAEKAARRAREREERGAAPGQPAQANEQQTPKKGGGKQDKQGGQKQTERRGSVAPAATESKKKKKEPVNENTPAMFAHLAGQSHKGGVSTAGKDVHPAILALGIQIRDYVICGSSARCVALLLAFKQLIVSYTTPAGTSLARHLTSHLSHQINFITTCRPLSVSQGNAIRGLKLVISKVGPRVPESDAKSELCEWIDNFITEKITVADQAIANSAAQKIKDGDVILCYGGSNIVRKTLLTAHRQEKKFRVSVVGSRPLFEGKHFARTLVEAGMEVEYCSINGITPAVKGATKVFLGAHAMTSNGCLYARVGTSLVAMAAKNRASGIDIPVIVCCETVKFTDRVSLDSIVVNEIADPDELVAVEPSQDIPGLEMTPEDATDLKSKKSKSEPAPPPTSEPKHTLGNWQDTPNLQLLNIMYDVTPRQYIDMVITEMGSLPPSAVPTVHRMSTESAEK